MVQPAGVDDVEKALHFARELGLPWLVLGLGSNVLVRDGGFPGVVLKLGKGLDRLEMKGATAIVGAGLPTPLLARRTAEAGFAGVERFIGIPGTVGGGVYMNAGCHGAEFAEVVTEVTVMDGAVLVGIDLGLGSGPYETAFDAPDAFERLVKSVERAVEKKTGRAGARARRVGLSAWSAGYGAIQKILGQKYGKQKVDSVILLDGLHCGYQGRGLNGLQIKAFSDFAREAAAGHKLMFVSHSSIIPPGYASTTETANFLIHEVGGKPKVSRGAPRSGPNQHSGSDAGGRSRCRPDSQPGQSLYEAGLIRRLSPARASRPRARCGR